MPIPDYATVHLCSILATFAFGVMFAVLWLGRGRTAHLLLCSVSSLTYGFALIGLKAVMPHGNIAAGIAMFLLLGASTSLVLAAVNAFDERPIFDRWVCLLPLLPALSYGVPAMLGGDPSQPRLLNSAALAICVSIVAWRLLCRTESRAPRSIRIVGMAHLLYLPGYVISIALELRGTIGFDALALIPMLSDQLLLGVLNFGLLAMAGERDAALLRDAALRDPLTGAWNRAALAALDQAHVPIGTVALAIDIDHFKQINDAHGHTVGDRVLTTLAQHITARLPEHGHLYRLGGDEFAATLGTIDDTAAHDLIAALLLPHVQAGLPPWTISIGMARTAPGDDGITAALDRADALLYRAKAGGRGRLAA